MKMTTRAALLKGPREIGLVEKELICGNDEVLVKNPLTGICGSDKSFYRGQAASADGGIEFINTCLVHHTWRERYVWTLPSLRPVVQGNIAIHSLVTNKFRLSEIKEAFDLADRDDAAIKIVLDP